MASAVNILKPICIVLSHVKERRHPKHASPYIIFHLKKKVSFVMLGADMVQ